MFHPFGWTCTREHFMLHVYSNFFGLGNMKLSQPNNISHIMLKEALQSLPLSYQKRAWLVPARHVFFWYNTIDRPLLFEKKMMNGFWIMLYQHSMGCSVYALDWDNKVKQHSAFVLYGPFSWYICSRSTIFLSGCLYFLVGNLIQTRISWSDKIALPGMLQLCAGNRWTFGNMIMLNFDIRTWSKWSHTLHNYVHKL